MVKLGRPPIIPRPDGTLHASARWENRLWIHDQSTKYGLTYGQIVDELVESLRKDRLYNPERLAQILSTNPLETEDNYYKDLLENSSNVKSVIQNLDRERRQVDI